MHRAWLEVTWLAALVLSAGCNTDAQEGDRPGVCNDLQTSARMTVEAAIDTHRACETASDCMTIAFQASCFDSCTRAIAKTGMAAVQAAIDDVDVHACVESHDNQCVVTIPPCAPPSDVACNAGLCQ